MKCGRTLMDYPWLLTADRIRDFLHDCEEAVPDLTHEEVAHFGSRAITRAMGEGARNYRLNGFLERDLQGEAEDELLDAANYAVFESLKTRKAVEDGQLDAVKAEEDYRALLALAVDTIRLHERWRTFWAGRG